MQTYLNPTIAEWNELILRPSLDYSELEPRVTEIIERVRSLGDEAVLDYTSRFDKVDLLTTLVSEEEVHEAESLVPRELKQSIELARQNIERFHSAQLAPIEVVQTMPGVECWRKSIPIQKVGLYIPGGTAPLFSTILMLAVPASIAGCREVILASPPGPDGKLHPAILYTANLCGIRTIIKAGGVQAIAAMTFGTKTIPQVYKIFGPGNQYVTCAKQLVQKYGVAIDMPAGPSEVAVFADDSAIPSFVAADLLSQAEHGTDSQVVLVTTSKNLIEAVELELESQLALLPRKDIATKALEHSRTLYFDAADTAISFLNEYAPEHLILACRDARRIAEMVENAGSVFIGHYSPESVGDYASGTNHTLPTNGFARAYSGVSVDSFVRKITFQQLSPQGLQQLGPAVETMAAAEGLHAHKNAVTVRLNQLRDIQ